MSNSQSMCVCVCVFFSFFLKKKFLLVYTCGTKQAHYLKLHALPFGFD
jgi:hypothetical protein